jgi:hypothetical protein
MSNFPLLAIAHVLPQRKGYTAESKLYGTFYTTHHKLEQEAHGPHRSPESPWLILKIFYIHVGTMHCIPFLAKTYSFMQDKKKCLFPLSGWKKKYDRYNCRWAFFFLFFPGTSFKSKNNN